MFDEKITINGNTVNYWFDGVRAYVKINKKEPIDMQPHINHLHSLDRTRYELPNAVKNCACSSCNFARKQYGKRGIGWDKKTIYMYGIVIRIGMSAADIENKIETELRRK